MARNEAESLRLNRQVVIILAVGQTAARDVATSFVILVGTSLQVQSELRNTSLILTMPDSNLQEGLVYLVLGTVAFISAKIVYRLTLHPLAKYPGPFLSRVSSVSIPLQAASGDRHLHQLIEHKKYGPIVRIGPSSLSFSSPSALHTIYQSGRVNNPLRKSDYYKTVDAPAGAYSTHTEIDLRKHAFRRRILDNAFSSASMRSAEEFVIQNVDTFCQILGPPKNVVDEWSEPRDMNEISTYFAYDVMGDLVFGKRFDCMTSMEHRYVPTLITESSWFLYWVSHLPLQFIVRPVMSSPTLMSWIGSSTAQAEHNFVAYASTCVRSRISREQGTGKKVRKDMMHYILNARDPESGLPFTDEDLDAESSLLIAAGADTTSTVLAAAFYYLTLPSSKTILTHLQEQLRAEFKETSSIIWTTIRRQVYLQAVVEETLRLAPAAPSELPRTILQEPGIEIAGHLIPVGTTVGCAAYVLHHNEEAFPDSFSFRPERWIPNPSKPGSASNDGTHLQSVSPLQDPERVARARQSLCAFSLGSRGCVGKTLAYMELCLALAKVLWIFDIRRADDKFQRSIRSKEYAQRHGIDWRENEYQLKDVFITDREGPVVQFMRVQHDAL